MSPNGAMGGLHGLNNLNIGGRGNTDGGGSHHLGVNNSKTPKEAYKRIQGIGGGHSHERNGLSSDDRLNLSVDIAGRHGGQASSQHQINNSAYNMQGSRNQGYKKHS